MAMPVHAGQSLVFRLELEHEPGLFARLAAAVTEAGGEIRAVDMIQVRHGVVTRDLTVDVYDPDGGAPGVAPPPPRAGGRGGPRARPGGRGPPGGKKPQNPPPP
ncbi:MAG: hypothetical protein K6V73_07750, partial [Firmicutes bacterium]|nr:hypothetical protein [Bacillota bacterium]